MNIAIISSADPRKDHWNGYNIRYENIGISGTDQSFLLVAEHLAKTNNVYFISDISKDNTEYKNVKYKHINFLDMNSDIFDIIIIPNWFYQALIYSYKNLKQLIVWAHCFSNIDEYYIYHFIQNRNIQLKINIMSDWCTNYIKFTRPYTDKYFTYFKIPNPLMIDMISNAHIKEKNTFIFSAVFDRGGSICVDAFNKLSLENKHLHLFSYCIDDINKIENNKDITMHGSSGKNQLFEYLSKTEYMIYPLGGSPVHKDTFSYTIAEALAHEVIVLTYPVAALPELYEDTIAWLDFPKGSNIKSLFDYEFTMDTSFHSEEAIDNIVQKIYEIESDPTYKESLKRKGKQLVYKKFHYDIVGKGFEEMINS